MLKHKFAAGDRVLALPAAENANIRPGIYTIIKALPLAGRGCQYRVKNGSDTFERILDESMLRPADA